MTKRVAIVIGTRPECIKLIPVIEALRRRPSVFDVVVCSSGQHREMLAQTFACFAVKPDINLDIMVPDQDLPELTGLLLTSLSGALAGIKPDWVIVEGDTTSALAAALAAFYQRRRIAHVEAGLRTADPCNPFPEEMNRKLISSMAELHFAPTHRACAALRAENIPSERIHLTGNTVVDALMQLQTELATETVAKRVSEPVRLLTQSGDVILFTAHRRESLGADLAAICRAVRRIAANHPKRAIIVPAHLNPQVQKQMLPLLSGMPNLHFLPPLSYVDLVYVMSRAALILTDSGGIQEEAPSLGVPVLVLRWKTERPEVIDAGFAELVGADEERIVARANAWLLVTARRPTGANPYGDGRAAERIADILATWP